MDSFRRAPVTLAAIAAMTTFVSGCIAIDAASGMADVGVPALTTTGGVATSYFVGNDSDNANQPD